MIQKQIQLFRNIRVKVTLVAGPLLMEDTASNTTYTN